VSGPAEDLPRDMAHFEFVCHAPSDYYQKGQYRSQRGVEGRLIGCVWTSLGGDQGQGPTIEPLQQTAATGVVESEGRQHRGQCLTAGLDNVSDSQRLTTTTTTTTSSSSLREKTTRSHKAAAARATSNAPNHHRLMR